MGLGLLHSSWIHHHMVGPCHASICDTPDPFILNLAPNKRECFIDTLSSLGRSLEELHAVLGCQSSAFLGINRLRLVAFIRHKHSGDIRRGMLFDLLDPILDVVE